MTSVVIVTGASKGIGLSIVKYLLERKINVVGVSRSTEPLKHENFTYIQADLTDKKSSKLIIDKTIEKYGKLNGLILNAGVLEPVTRIENANVDDWKTLFDINLFSIIGLVSQAIPYLKSNNGRIVAVSSGASKTSYIGWSAYGASKAALNSFIQSIAVEEPSIFSISIAPGVVDTNMQENIRNLHSTVMGDHHSRFIQLKQTNSLVAPEIPASIISELVLRGKGNELNGSYLRYNDEKLKGYAAS